MPLEVVYVQREPGEIRLEGLKHAVQYGSVLVLGDVYLARYNVLAPDGRLLMGPGWEKLSDWKETDKGKTFLGSIDEQANSGLRARALKMLTGKRQFA